MNVLVKTKQSWTKADQAALDELTARKERVMLEQREPLIEVVNRMPAKSQALVDWLIHNADAVRDALQPFDSGVRPG